MYSIPYPEISAVFLDCVGSSHTSTIAVFEIGSAFRLLGFAGRFDDDEDDDDEEEDDDSVKSNT